MPTGIIQLEITSLRERARQSLRAGIITGEIPVGAIFPIASFAERLGVSVTPVREALLDLATAGLVEIIRNRGFRVVTLTNGELDHILEVRLLLEIPAAGRIAGKLTKEQADLSVAYMERAEMSAKAGDLPTFLEMDRLFHLSLMLAMGNPKLAEIVDALRLQARLAGLREMTLKGRLPETVREHREIMAAVIDGDSGGAEDAMHRHLIHSRGAWAGLPEFE